MTLLELETLIRDQSEMIHTDYIGQTEIRRYINLSLKELYALLVTVYQDYYVTSGNLSFAANEESKALPTGATKVLGVDAQVTSSPSSWVTLNKFQFGQRNQFAYPQSLGQVSQGWSNIRYQVRGDSIYLSPLPANATVLKVWYIPEMTELAADADQVSFDQTIYGWVQYVVADVAIKCLTKQDTDIRPFVAAKQDLINRVNAEAANRDQGGPTTTVDVYATGNAYENQTGPFNGGGFGFNGL